MYILSQDKNRIANTNIMKGIHTVYNVLTGQEICLEVIGTEDDPWSWIRLGAYQNKERANEILQLIFRALKSSEPTFEMPEV